MFVCIERHKNKGNLVQYVIIKESYRDESGKPRSRVVQRLGRLDLLLEKDPDVLEKLKAQCKQQGEEKKTSDILASLDRIEKLTTMVSKGNTINKGTLLNYGYYPLRQIWSKDLRLDQNIDYLQKAYTKYEFSLDQVISYLVFRKILDPRSILYSFSERDRFLGNPAVDTVLANYYASYDFLKDHKDKILKHVNKRMDSMFGRNRASLVFYDVTNAYFESPLTDEEMGLVQKDYIERVMEYAARLVDEGKLPNSVLTKCGEVNPSLLPEWVWDDASNKEKLKFLRMRGPSKEHRTDLPIVSIAMVIDANGFPMDFEVFSGNASEFKTMKAAIAGLKKKYNIKNAIVVADRGLNSTSNLKMLKDLHLGYLVAQKVSQFPKTIESQMLDLSKYQPISESDPSAGKFRIIKNWKKGTGKDSVECTLMLTFDENRYKRDMAVLDAWVHLIEKKVSQHAKVGANKSGWAGLAKTPEDPEQPVLGVDEEALAEKRKLCGFAAIVFDTPGDKKKNESDEIKFPIAGTYKKLSEIENCFRIMKNNLGLRPMYVWTSDHIRGHVLVCFLALLLVRLLQNKLESNNAPMSINKICSSLNKCQVMAIYNSATDDYLFVPANVNSSAWDEDPTLEEKEIIKRIESGRIQIRDYSDDILAACGLVPLSSVCSRAELARRLGTRFDTVDAAVSAVRWKLDRLLVLRSQNS